MKKLITLLLLGAGMLAAQTPTVVSAAVTDPNGSVYANGTWTAQLVNPSGVPYYNLSQVSLPGSETGHRSGSLDSNGSFTVNLLPNAGIAAGSQWSFRICAGDMYAACFVSAQTISGTTQNVSGALSAAAVITGPLHANQAATKGYVDAHAPSTTSVGTRMRNAVAAAAGGTAISRTAMLAAPAWVGSTAYLAGVVVQNGGLMYMCWEAGTSASSGGPTGSAAAPIADGTAHWYYYGVASASVSPLPVLTATSTAAACNTGLAQNILMKTSPSLFTVLGGVAFNLSGNNMTFPQTTISATANGSADTSGHRNNNSASAQFYTNSNKFCISANASSVPMNILIDDRYLIPGGIYNTYISGTGYLLVDLTALPANTVRKITIETWQAGYIQGVFLSSYDSLWASSSKSPLNAVRLMCVGNSIEAGGNSSILGAYQSSCGVAGKLLGIHDTWNLAIGGTDWLALGAGNAYYNYGQHLTDVTNNSPDAVIFALGGINDTSSTPAAVAAEALNDIAKLRTFSVKMPIIVTGIWPGSRGPGTGVIAEETAIMAAMAALNDPNIYLIPVSTATPAWINGTGTVSATTGTGNADLLVSNDGTHPTILANYVVAQQLVQSLFPIIQVIP